ncbi:MAG: SRPBCC family protein [candidate division Zixibacteria bacterium]|jgi:ligand-binding SRPBCC domain-containing protein|nr:SRPBCC family protein [candidate division Zixibacteria bacterium]NIR62895.1 SRPBCC family protein [candidate division Zixibacteria bacterium]NIS16003.1 SRPBCC family protein [candidate division Zixibacteria bacterium]NIS44910.1 SRPBCC family protein [candidate division Zixibacteria bacterium]NIT52412.1 SRPBCC family protein [candidate division Zixibacteria bacterium]
MPKFEQVTYIERDIQTVFDFHLDLNNLLKISPDDANLQIFHAPEKVEKGSRIGLFVKIGPITTTMETVVEVIDPPYKFVDRQVGGFFSKWVHTHLFEKVTENKTKLTDRIEYSLPGGVFTNVVGGGIAHRKIEEMFRHRAERTKKLLEEHSD